MHWTQRMIKANAKRAAARQRYAAASPAGRGKSHGYERERIIRAANRDYRKTIEICGVTVRGI